MRNWFLLLTWIVLANKTKQHGTRRRPVPTFVLSKLSLPNDGNDDPSQNWFARRLAIVSECNDLAVSSHCALKGEWCLPPSPKGVILGQTSLQAGLTRTLTCFFLLLMGFCNRCPLACRIRTPTLTSRDHCFHHVYRFTQMRGTQIASSLKWIGSCLCCLFCLFRVRLLGKKSKLVTDVGFCKIKITKYKTID